MNKRTQEYATYINSASWEKKRKEAFAAYGRVCQKCGAEGKLHVHHKTYKHFGNERINELQILCDKCHQSLHKKRNKRRSKKRKKKKRLTTSNACYGCIEYLGAACLVRKKTNQVYCSSRRTK